MAPRASSGDTPATALSRAVGTPAAVLPVMGRRFAPEERRDPMTATPRHEPLRSPQATVSTVQRRRPMIPRTATADPRPSGSLSERAYLLIRDQIISLKFTPGGVIEESRLMEQLGIGRTPIREALKRLAWENLVRIIPRRGMIVGDINITDLAHISEARIGLEGYAVRVAAGRVQDEDRATMQNLLSELKRLKRTVDNTELIRLDQSIHRQMYYATHNRYLCETLEQYYRLSLRIWFLALPKVTRMMEAVQEHEDLLQAVLQGDGARAERIVQRHIAGFHEEIKRIL